MPENPYRGRQAAYSSAFVWDEGFAAGEAAERERIVKLLRETADAEDESPTGDYYIPGYYHQAADLIERTAKEDE